ncbi:MAG: hypothetical protein ACOYLQ_06485 [Hyphomicrobiaceae bacterium]
MSSVPESTPKTQPPSLGDHLVPADRRALIESHVALLAETARRVGDDLPLSADVSDMIAVLEAEIV